MKLPVFGKKGVSPIIAVPSGPDAPPQASEDVFRSSLLARLRDMDAHEPLARPRLAGKTLFGQITKSVERDGRVRIEEVLAILGSNGGFACIRAVVNAIARREEMPSKVEKPLLFTCDGEDGHRYLFGNWPNLFLVEHEHSLLRLALGTAQACGGAVSLDMVHATMKHVAATVGGAAFGVPVLPEPNRPTDRPVNYVERLWPKILEILAAFEVPDKQMPMAIGFAIQYAIKAGKEIIEPALAARVVIECAVPMAKIDPARFTVA